MFYEAITIAVALIVIAGIVCIALARSPAVPDVKRTNEQMNAEEAHRAELRAKDAELRRARVEIFRARAALVSIRNHFAGQKSGSAVKAHRMAVQGLEG